MACGVCASANSRAAAGPVVSSFVRKLSRQPIKTRNGSADWVAMSVTTGAFHPGAAARRRASTVWMSKAGAPGAGARSGRH